MKNKRFAVISIHYTTKCNMNPPCPFCYKKQDCKVKEKPLKFWYDLVPYISKLSNQIALGGGEPTTNLPFIKKFGKICKKNKVILNITSNGRILAKLNDRELRAVLKDITMISLSYDDYKVKTKQDLKNYIQLVKRIKKITKCQVGSNLLVNEKMFENKGTNFIKVVNNLFKIGVNRVFALSPKNIPCPDILKFKLIYQYLTIKHEHFYLDDLGKMILEEGKYNGWCKSCHYGKGMISISETGTICGCSFDGEDKALLKLKNPKDILKITKIKPKERFSCPYLNRK